jgi:hypothetical protein
MTVYLTYEELQSAMELMSEPVRDSARRIYDAINDFPVLNLIEPEEFISVLQTEVGAELTYDNIKRYSESLKSESDAWKVESLTSLIQVEELKSVTLGEFLMHLTIKFRSFMKEKQ